MVWGGADQSEAGFAEAQLAAYGFRPFGFTGSWQRLVSVVGRRTPRVNEGTACRGLARRGMYVVCGAWCGCVRTSMAWSSVFMRWPFATAVSFVASGGCSLRNACMVGAWCVSLRDLAVLGGCESLCVGATGCWLEVVCTVPPDTPLPGCAPRSNVLQHENVMQHAEEQQVKV